MSESTINAVVPTIVLLEVFHKCVYKFHMNLQEVVDFIKQLALVISYNNIPKLDIDLFFESIEICKNAGMLPIDASIATYMKNNQIKVIISNNKDFDRVNGIQRIDPIPQH